MSLAAYCTTKTARTKTTILSTVACDFWQGSHCFFGRRYGRKEGNSATHCAHSVERSSGDVVLRREQEYAGGASTMQGHIREVFGRMGLSDKQVGGVGGGK